MSTMEEPRPSSPTFDQVEKPLDEKSECQKSPTTVIEAESVAFTQTFPPSSSPDCVDYDEIVEEPFVEKPPEVPPPPPPPRPSRRLRRQRRGSRSRRKKLERRRCLNILPTIQECSEEEEHDTEVMSLSLPPLSEADDSLFHLETLTPSTISVHDMNNVQQQIDDASRRASKGNEGKALTIYKSVLGTLEKETDRISERIKVLAMKQTNFVKSKVHISLHQEWAEYGLVVADVKRKMATIYERQENYVGAQWSAEEARAIYHHQATFEAENNKSRTSACDMELAMEDMMEQIEEAMDSHPIRKQLHQTVERIREKISATEDETSRGFLYEDIFDKLSTVLSLELMYLGQDHPQVANTKALFGKFYSEIKQNEKALKVVNEAISICEEALGDSHPQTASKYQEAAKLHNNIEDDENCSMAIELYEKAIAAFQKAEGNVSEELCSCLNRVAMLYIQRQKYDDAIEKLRRAIHISEENYRERPDNMSTEPIQLWLNLGECHSLEGIPELSSIALKNALRIQQDKGKVFNLLPRKRAGSIPDLISNSKIALTLKKLGKSLVEESKLKESSSYFMEALTILREELKAVQEKAKYDPKMDLSGHEDEVASVLYDLAKVKQEEEKFNEAIELYKESLEMRKESDRKRAVSERSNNVACALCLAGIGSIEIILKKESDAFKSFNQALFYAKQEGIPDSDPVAQMLWEKSRIAAINMNKVQNYNDFDKIDHHDIVIFPLEKKAKEFREEKDYKSSVKTINTVIRLKRTHMEKAVADDQAQIAKAKRHLAASLVFKGELAFLMGERKDAKDCINEASTLFEESGMSKNDGRFRQIEKFHSKIKATEYLNIFSGWTSKDQTIRKFTEANGETGTSNKMKNIGFKIRWRKQRSHSTMGEF